MMENTTKHPRNSSLKSGHERANDAEKAQTTTDKKPEEIGGSNKPEPTRYGDWEIGGKCVDF